MIEARVTFITTTSSNKAARGEMVKETKEEANYWYCTLHW